MVDSTNPLAAKRIVLAVTGSIAAYKAADVASTLVQLGVAVDVILSEGARQFIQPLTFSALTRRPVHGNPFADWTAELAGHVTLAAADLVLVAPATAQTLARLSLGLADDLLGMVALATSAPLVVAPAMEHGMWHHPATQEHLHRLRERGAVVIGPGAGRLASGASGDGRLAATGEIVGVTRAMLGRVGPLAGTKVVVSAGGTHEPIDPVRFIGNRSSGLMGLALAQAAIDLGAMVTVVAGPTQLPMPHAAEIIRVETAEEMLLKIQGAVEGARVLIMAAAVGDFRPAQRFEQKYKKANSTSGLTVELIQNPDILATIQAPSLIKVGFAAETEHLVANARAKLERKSLQLVVANDAAMTIGSDESKAILIALDGEPEVLPAMRKTELAAVIMDRVTELVTNERGSR
ncbi:MAG: bifunctional phosphopantothenoylcysteine decarboxylase/phosphopantothenate--cysteine ligase CoaBC, partial [Chloroflexota bacterium]|nr:bifunctional phosphopantothenoylcysteine decarboxylase/phosphopantothenate--cysteine ligase CoaBC [Chloroflexota bacterium]